MTDAKPRRWTIKGGVWDTTIMTYCDGPVPELNERIEVIEASAYDALEARIAELSESCSSAEKMVAEQILVINQREARIVELEAALRFYAEGGSDLEPVESKRHLYAKNFPMDSPEWRQRSMSDYTTGKVAREVLAKKEVK